nr:RidA family protein [uncultured Moellerella sp.]
MRYRNLLFCLPLLCGVANAEGVVHNKLAGMPISESVVINSSKDIVFLSGKVPTKISKEAPEGVLASYGNTEAQTINILEQVKAHLGELGLEMKDVVKMQVFLVGGDETKGNMDFAGFSAGYAKFFNEKDSKTLPARTTVQVAKLANPAWRVEIEVTAVRP